mmetsp:Transcript_75846/g.226122  ORF Transcript_75846/g.226122 Transcript_75846/m.226122 type:complete len:247 (-) Transcript_75846:219-959(-)
MVFFGALPRAHVPEELPHFRVVGLLFKFQVAHPPEVSLEFRRVTSTQLLQWYILFLFADLPVLLLLCLCLQPGPGKLPSEEVDEHVAYGFHVIPAALLQALVRIDGGIARSAREVQLRPGVAVLPVPIGLAEAEIDQVQVVNLLFDPKHEVFRLDVPVDDALGVKVLDATQDLLSHQHSGWHIESTSAELQAVLEGLAQQVHDQAQVPPLMAEMVALDKALDVLARLAETLQDLCLVLQLGCMALG